MNALIVTGKPGFYGIIGRREELLRLQLLRQHFGVGAKPFRLLDKFSVLSLENAHPTAAFMISGTEVERRNDTT